MTTRSKNLTDAEVDEMFREADMPTTDAMEYRMTGKAVLYNGEWLSPVGPKPRPLWVLPPGAHNGPEGTYMVNWQERGGGTSQQYVDADDVRDCPLVARAAAGQDVDADGPQDLEPLNQGLGLLVEVKKERDEVKKERDDRRAAASS